MQVDKIKNNIEKKYKKFVKNILKKIVVYSKMCLLNQNSYDGLLLSVGKTRRAEILAGRIYLCGWYFFLAKRIEQTWYEKLMKRRK